MLEKHRSKSLEGSNTDLVLLSALEQAGALTYLDVDARGHVLGDPQAFFHFFHCDEAPKPPLRLADLLYLNDLAPVSHCILQVVREGRSVVIQASLRLNRRTGRPAIPCHLLVTPLSPKGPSSKRLKHPSQSAVRLYIFPVARLDQDLESLRLHRLVNLGSLSAGVSHDLNNLLTGISSFTTLLERDLPNSERKSYLDLIRRTVQRACRLTGSILSYLKEEESVALPMDPLACVRDMVCLMKQTLSDDISVHVCLPKKTHAVLIPRSQLCQVILNLLINARDAIRGQGDIRVEASFEPEGSPEAFVLRVSDTGVGIREQDLPLIFRPFFSRKRQEESGTGLGLPIVKKIVSEAAGKISVDSREGEYSCFTVELPITTRRSLQKHPEKVRGGNECVLIQQCGNADSYPLYELLIHKGYDCFMVTEEPCVHEVKEHLEQSPHLLIIDVVDSLDLAICALDRFRSVYPQVQALITVSPASSMEPRLPSGVQILQKPFESYELWRAVRRQLDGNFS